MEAMKKNNDLCKELAKDPYFEIDMVVGKPWRVFYTWNMKMETGCLNIVFRNATPQIVQRIWNDMYEYMEQQPAWDAATLYVTMGKARHQLLLFADQGPAGSFVGVPNVVRDGNILPSKQAVPLLKFQLRLLREGKFLVMTDCQTGLSSLSSRADEIPYRSEILAATAPLNLGDGFPACINEKNKDEQFFVK